MRTLLSRIFPLLFICLVSCSNPKTSQSELSINKKPVIIAYVGGFRGLIDPAEISAKKITHINYAFVDVVDGKAFLTNEVTDTVNFRKLNLLKKDNPDLKIMISIGGWTWSRNFSDAVLTEDGREMFARSAVDIMHSHGLDGVDIDWEYPALPGDTGNIYRPEDKQNYTLMFKEIRENLDSLEKVTSKKYLLTTATGGFEKFIQSTEMDKAQQYLDFVNIMTYDYFPEKQAAHHTNLYNSDRYQPERSADSIVHSYVKAGVPLEKLVMGIAFYGRSFEVIDGSQNGLGDEVVKQTQGRGYTFIKDSLVGRGGYERYFDEKAKAPYLFNKEQKVFVTYDDEESVKYKCEYVLNRGMGGVMFWEYSSDQKEYLLDEINKTFHQ
ncbi:glycoside hydrolase family 18 protein [Dysgonomonas sp. OttesenSCG-928-M03]|nr:glycoside hydrolase family 18 protein [Dysgonomonas sp. OttesenSCG-928-M03]